MKHCEVKYCQDGGLTTATVWRDKGKIAVLSTNVTRTMIPLQRRGPGRLIQFITPSPVIVYNKFMFGVDLADQHRLYYVMGRSGLQWWRYVSWFLFQTAIMNSWVLFKLRNNPALKNCHQMSQIQFQLDCVPLLLQDANLESVAPLTACQPQLLILQFLILGDTSPFIFRN
ncbi:PiggyBac transposable element-derived protein 4-like [Plakobranchus ocellatus]|uniref:PiggyBac transposable element-derived protein 4-like n=1 Tax=Plakobranchus ocellatus TaxID=259542 RepID=A0AAV3ZF10_9GAST|nr:PiggyBac transposable element-derived protein 4-like [Plakobranchus ocellatus]